MTHVWVAYYSDWSGFVLFAEEIEALRHAVENHMAVAHVPFGESVREFVNAELRR